MVLKLVRINNADRFQEVLDDDNWPMNFFAHESVKAQSFYVIS